MRARKRMRSAAKFTGAFVLGTPDAGNRRWGTSVDGVGVGRALILGSVKIGERVLGGVNLGGQT